MSSDSEEYLFDPDLLKDTATPDNLDTSFKLRPLKSGDNYRGFLDVLSQLTTIGTQEDGAFHHQFTRMKEAGTYFVLVMEDVTTGRIVATTTLFLEYKFIHGNGMRGRIEDVAVDDGYQGRKLGKAIVSAAVSLSKLKLNCYKLSLDCRDQVVPFYKSMGFTAEPGRSNMLVQRFSQ